MKVGDIVSCEILVASLCGVGRPGRERGTVVYIHPKGRFYRVRFDFPGGSWCESFIPEGGI